MDAITGFRVAMGATGTVVECADSDRLAALQTVVDSATRRTVMDVITNPNRYLDVTRVDSVPDGALWAFIRDNIGMQVSIDAANAGNNPADMVADAVVAGGVTLFTLLDYLRTCTVVAIYDDKQAVKRGLILHYTVVLNDRRRDGDRWVYNAICLSDDGMYEYANVARGRQNGAKINHTDLPVEVQRTLVNLGYFI